jgi:hypothetical protein
LTRIFCKFADLIVGRPSGVALTRPINELRPENRDYCGKICTWSFT